MDAPMLTSRRLSRDPQLRTASANSPALARGAEGTGVAILQDLLADLGAVFVRTFAHGKADGIFGVETDAAVRAYQKKKGLKADGVAGKMTLQALDGDVLANYRLEDREGRQDVSLGYW